jgi:hypothetical protein
MKGGGRRRWWSCCSFTLSNLARWILILGLILIRVEGSSSNVVGERPSKKVEEPQNIVEDPLVKEDGEGIGIELADNDNDNDMDNDDNGYEEDDKRFWKKCALNQDQKDEIEWSEDMTPIVEEKSIQIPLKVGSYFWYEYQHGIK